MPLVARADVGDGTWGVVFDQPLQTATLDPESWTFRIPPLAFEATTAIALENRVGGTMAFSGIAGVGPDVSYAATPADLLSAAGVPAPPFLNFPLT